MGTEFRTVLVLDEKLHEVQPGFLVFAYNGEARTGFESTPVLSPEPRLPPVDSLLLRQWMDAFNKPPVGFVIDFKEKEFVFGCVKVGAIAGDGVEVTGIPLPEKIHVHLFQNFGPSGSANYLFPPKFKHTFSLTIGASIRINHIFEQHDWPLPFTDDIVLRNRRALKEDGSIAGVR